MKNKIIKSVNVEARRWFQKSYGNTYHTVKLSVKTADDECLEIHSKIHYGYGDHFLVTSKNLLEKFGFETLLEDGKNLHTAHLREKLNGTYDVLDVDRKKDLKHFDSSKLLNYVTSIYE